MPIPTENSKMRSTMLCLCGFELYSRWVPLNKLWPKRTTASEKFSPCLNQVCHAPMFIANCILAKKESRKTRERQSHKT